MTGDWDQWPEVFFLSPILCWADTRWGPDNCLCFISSESDFLLSDWLLVCCLVLVKLISNQITDNKRIKASDGQLAVHINRIIFIPSASHAYFLRSLSRRVDHWSNVWKLNLLASSCWWFSRFFHLWTLWVWCCCEHTLTSFLFSRVSLFSKFNFINLNFKVISSTNVES